MVHKIEILSPGPGCRKTQRIIDWLFNVLKRNQIEFEFKNITDQNTLSGYRTWILPTVVINNKIVSRGYKPTEKKILEALNH